MALKKWKLLTSKDVSPSKWFPLEQRSYQMPNGQQVDDFFVTTLADSVHVVSITTEGKVVLIKMYKQGVDEIMIQFPAGRYEAKHADHRDAAVRELAEEAGIKVAPEELEYIGKLALMTTKASEVCHFYFVKDVIINTSQNLDETEQIEVITLTPSEIDAAIADGTIWDAPCIAGWQLVRTKMGL